MAFRPDTKYYINGSEYATFYEAINAARLMANGTVVKDESNNVVFTKNGNANTYHLYQYNNYYGTSDNLTYGSSEIISGATNNATGKMKTWLNNYAYSKAVTGEGKLSNSRIRTFYKHTDINLNDVYSAQEKASGGYYSVRTLNSIYDGKSSKAAKITVNLNNVTTNLTNTNAYAFLGMMSSGHFFECGFQLQKINSAYKWCVIFNSTNEDFDTLYSNFADLSDGGTATIELVRSNGKITAYAKYNNSLICTKEYTDSYFGDSNYNEFYRTISFCPNDSNTNPTPNFNNSQYFAGISFGDCYIRRGSAAYVDWNYDSSFNQYAAAFNDEFINVTPSTETVSISYKGRNSSGNLIVS